jgi:glycosyltransferase involved in cell wall biosynthesis
VEFLKRPTISVIIPNYNHSRFLPRCLSALLNQSLLPDEIIVVDDGSSDGSWELLRTFAENHPLIRAYRHDKNMGVSASLNHGVDLAGGEYLLFTAADDEAKPQLLERAVPMLQSHPQAGLCCGIAEWRCMSTGTTWYIGGNMPRQPCYLSPEEMIRLGRNMRLSLTSQTSLFKRQAFTEAGSWKPELKWCDDCFMTYVVAFRHGVCFVPEVLSIFYLYADSHYHSDAERRPTLDRFLQLLESEEYADVSTAMAQSGILGGFGWDMARVVMGQRRHWQFLNAAFALTILRRCLEVAGRRFFPNWLSRICLRIFYGPGRHQPSPLAGSAIALQ